jgi:hypothetical protein
MAGRLRRLSLQEQTRLLAGDPRHEVTEGVTAMPNERTPKFMIVNPVKPGREVEFESFVRDVIIPAAEQVRPHIMGTWRLLSPARKPAEGVQAAPVFLFYGDSWDDYELEDMFKAAYGEETGKRRNQEFEGFLASEQIAYEFDGELDY